MSFFDKLKGFLLDPVETFNETKDGTIGDAVMYILPIIVIYAVLYGLIAFSAFSTMMGPLNPFGALGGGAFSAMMVVGTIIGMIIGIFIGGAIMHIFVYIVGGRNGIGQTIKAVLYGSTPNLLLGWIPIINIFTALWTLVLNVIGIREYHDISTGRAILAVLLPVIIIAIIFVIAIVGTLMAGMSGFSGSSPYMVP